MSLQDKTVVITGGTGGIGLQTALALAQQGARVLVMGRNKASGETAVADLRQRSGNSRVKLVLGDLTTLAGVRALAAQVTQAAPRLDVLINNAGLAAPSRKVTVDGLEAMFAVNVVAPYLLAQLVWAPLQASPAGRVVTLTGGSHPARFEFDNLQTERAFDGLNAYSHSKLAMMAVMLELAERVRGSSVTVNVCYPGQASTAMTQGVTPEMLPAGIRWAFPLFRWVTRPDGGKSAAKAARSSVYLATSPEVADVTGQYFDTRCRRVAWPAPVQDPAGRARVWETVTRVAPFTLASAS